MRYSGIILLFIISFFEAKSQYPYYKAITIKSNILSWVNLSVECPIYNRFTTEFSWRQIDYSEHELRRQVVESGNHSKKTVRVNLKYHFPKYDDRGRYYSIYLFSGINKMIHTMNRNFGEKGQLDISRLSIGFGTKRRRVDIWLAFEQTIKTRQNIYYPEGNFSNTPPTKWLPNIGISGGIAINLLNIKLNRLNQ